MSDLTPAPTVEEVVIPTSAVMYRVAGRNYPLVTSRTCQTCRSPYRAYVENRLLQGHSYKAIVDALPEDAGLNTTEIGNHYRKKHLPLEEQARRAIIESRANELHLDPETHITPLADHITWLRLGINRITERMALREVEPTIADGIRMAATLAAIEAQAGDSEQWSLDEIAQGVRLMMEIARGVMSEEQFQRYSHQLATNSYLKELSGQEPDALPTG